MATEWTKQELLKAAQYMAAIPALDLLPGQRMSADEILAAAERGERGLGRVRLHLEHICQRNRALAALKAIVPLLDSDLDAVKEWQDEAQQVHAAIAACWDGHWYCNMRDRSTQVCDPIRRKVKP